jgi:DNA-binding response OmpR family regulator
MRIFAVDDDPTVLELLGLILKHECHGTIVAETAARDALKTLADDTEGFDCLILDIAMPDIDGIELCRLVRSMPAYSATPIIMLTAKDDSSSIEQAFSAGANDYITKPFDIKEISSRIGVAAKMRDLDNNFQPERFDDASSEQVVGSHSFKITDPILFAHMNGLTDHFSLGNYLVQLERHQISSRLVFAVKIEQISELYNECTSQDLATILRCLSTSVTKILEDYQTLSAHMGGGVFLFICDERMQKLWPELEERTEAELQKNLNNNGVVSPVDITVAIGRPSRPNSSRTKRVGPAFEKAIAAAERRQAIKAKGAASKMQRFIF